MAAEVPASPCGGSHESGDQSPRSNVRELDRLLPIAFISRIMKKALRPKGKIAKDAKETMQECVFEFISFITCEARDKCLREKRKKITEDDVLCAMTTLDRFEDYIKPHRLYSQKYKEIEGDGKGSAKGAESSGKRDAGGLQGGNLSGSSMQGDMKMLQQGSFTEGMNYMNTQVGQMTKASNCA
ncbi:nuclear transcription factor Y subunit B-1 [Dendrobium catenatum]|uniref:nuclear transcription factor Y subunit B-1 n=1 Tax=Dendrobium catenatum TaxID=906689 RepID=UPI0009F1BDFC|nr:nuclear transcription factor Y subunit B-1 [Dendrobium catenatum]